MRFVVFNIIVFSALFYLIEGNGESLTEFTRNQFLTAPSASETIETKPSQAPSKIETATLEPSIDDSEITHSSEQPLEQIEAAAGGSQITVEAGGNWTVRPAGTTLMAPRDRMVEIDRLVAEMEGVFLDSLGED